MGRLSGKQLHWAVTAASCQAFLLLGYDQGVMSGLVGADNEFGKQFGHPDATMQGILTSIYDIGCAVGCILSFVIGHRVGRKRMIIAGGSIMIIGTIILGASYSTAQFLVGRIVTGFGNGINSSTVPTYQSEMARPELRGMLLSAQGTVTIVGLCIAYWLDYGLSFVNSPAQWRFPISFQAFFAVLLVLQMLPLPDTPRWLCEQDRSDQAASVLARLQIEQPSDESTPEVIVLRRQIETAIETESAGGPFQYKELFTGGKMQNMRRMILAGLVNVQQQFTGSNMINYYAPIVYENTMDVSRNLSLILGAAPPWPTWWDQLFRYGLFLGIGYLPVPWFYPSEITTTRIRARGQAFAGFVNWMCVFIVVQVTPTAIDNIGWQTFIIFACFCFAWIPMVYFFFPETKGLELEDVDHLFEKGGITGGVFESRGHPVQPGLHRHLNTERIVKTEPSHVEHAEV
ncbi:Major facilitator superfamily domain general substrate transporter [Penicillium capsulatum]|uniref:Major facilitator superfamily domain general substrate transporter n=1 Tax=Penicillium capsulatum TaxID=69766 RepID=A0A9W9ISD1_9EURO|nr:Major facilitator superfamily domain general substrate transporter [Penicillium capsulatum]